MAEGHTGSCWWVWSTTSPLQALGSDGAVLCGLWGLWRRNGLRRELWAVRGKARFSLLAEAAAPGAADPGEHPKGHTEDLCVFSTSSLDGGLG